MRGRRYVAEHAKLPCTSFRCSRRHLKGPLSLFIVFAIWLAIAVIMLVYSIPFLSSELGLPVGFLHALVLPAMRPPVAPSVCLRLALPLAASLLPSCPCISVGTGTNQCLYDIFEGRCLFVSVLLGWACGVTGRIRTRRWQPISRQKNCGFSPFCGTT